MNEERHKELKLQVQSRRVLATKLSCAGAELSALIQIISKELESDVQPYSYLVPILKESVQGVQDVYERIDNLLSPLKSDE